MFSRTAAALLLLAVLPVGCGDNPAGPDGAEPFLGVWFSEDPATRGITRVQIVRQNATVAVRMWGACVPDPCDWGTVNSPASSANDGTLDLTWNQGFAIVTQRLTITGARLLVEGFTRFVDNSGRANYNSTEYFVR
jgi:hypothetical protein